MERWRLAPFRCVAEVEREVGSPQGLGPLIWGASVSKQVLCIVFRQSAARVKLKGCWSVLRILQTSKCQQVIVKGQIMTYLICQGFLASRWLCALRKSFTLPPSIMVSPPVDFSGSKPIWFAICQFFDSDSDADLP